MRSHTFLVRLCRQLTWLLNTRVDFQQNFLRTEDYPNDPFKAVTVPHGRVLVLHESEPLSQYWSNVVAIPMPVPDMSMPFNVIMITSTILSVAFSSFYALASSEMVFVEREMSPKPSLLKRLKMKFI